MVDLEYGWEEAREEGCEDARESKHQGDIHS
jgi:hypothetical protein